MASKTPPKANTKGKTPATKTTSRQPKKPAHEPKVHGEGEAQLDGVLRLIEEATREAPLGEVLAGQVAAIAQLLRVEVCSVYLLEGPEGAQQLVMRATHGYPQDAVGRVRLRVGEGLTGFAVECLRPVSVAAALVDARNRQFADLDESLYPALCAVPLLDGGRAVGALVIQRREQKAFTEREVVLLAAMASPLLFALERARARAGAERVAKAEIDLSKRPQDVTIEGKIANAGSAIGTAHVRGQWTVKDEKIRAKPSTEHARLGKALASAADEIAQLESWAATHSKLATAEARRLLASSRFVLDDAQLRERMLDHVEEGATAEQAVTRVVREYTRALTQDGDAMLIERAIEVEALGWRVMARLQGRTQALKPASVLCASRVAVCDVLELGAAHGSAIVLHQAAAESTIGVARALRLPMIVEAAELFRWVADGDRLLVDGNKIIVNPSQIVEAEYRRNK